MSLPLFSDLKTYIGKLLLNTDWDYNFQKVVSWLSDGTTDLSVNKITAAGALTGTTGSFSSAVTASSFVGSGAALTGINSPIGGTMLWPALTDPAKWLICDGRQVARAGTYAALYAIIGTAFGSGDGVTTYNLPDMRDMVPRGISWGSKTFAPADVDTGNDLISIASHNLNRNGKGVRFTTATSLPGGLSLATTYYVRVKTSSTFEVYDTKAHAIDRKSACRERVCLYV